MTFSPLSPVDLPASKALNVTLNIFAGATATPGNATIKVQGVSGANSQTASFTLRVVQYRVVMIHSTFSPAKLNVTVGSTVYWQNIDGPVAACGPGASTGNGAHSVVFTTLPGVNSSTIKQFGIYSHTFNTAGSYFYYSSVDTDHIMNGTINVVAANGGGGMMSVSMPAFSYFKVSSAPAVASTSTTTATTTVANPIYSGASTSSIAAGGLALAGLVFFSSHSSVLSGLGFGAVLAVLLGAASLGLVLAMSATGKRMPAPLRGKITARLLPSDSAVGPTLPTA